VVFAPLIEALVRAFGLTSTFLILAAVFFIIVLALFRFIKMPDEEGAGNTPSSSALAERQYETKDILKTKEFYFITLSLMFATAVFFFLNPSLKNFASERGLAESVGTVLVMLTGVANALGRLGAPLLSDKIGREKAVIAIILPTAAGAFALCFAQGAVFMATIAVVAFCYGGFSGIYPVLTAEYFGIKNVGSNYGAVMMGFALSALTFPMLVGLISGTAARFIVLGILAAIGVLLIIMLSASKKKQGAANKK
jgi:OFA family oxalate/formate antiporter-like MFS transporter